MKVTEYEGILTVVDEEGNESLLYPDTKTDDSLSKAGKAADAAATGDKLEAINKSIAAINEAIPYKIVIDDNAKTINFIDR